MSTLLDEVINDLETSAPPENHYQGQGQDHYQGQHQGHEPEQNHVQRRVHFEDDSDSGEGYLHKLKGALKADKLKTPLAVLFAVLLASLPQVNDLVDKIPYITDNWMLNASFKAIVLAILVYLMKIH